MSQWSTVVTASSRNPGEWSSRREELLVEYLREHDAACPVCGFNLRALTRPVCPECRHALVLAVDATGVRLGPLLLALAPGIFAGLAACVLAIPTIAIFAEDGILIPPLLGGVLFGWCSGPLAILLAFRWRARFLALPRTRQRSVVVTVWTIHLIAAWLFVVGFAASI